MDWTGPKWPCNMKHVIGYSIGCKILNGLFGPFRHMEINNYGLHHRPLPPRLWLLQNTTLKEKGDAWILRPVLFNTHQERRERIERERGRGSGGIEAEGHPQGPISGQIVSIHHT
ncbi:hypothetical protein SAY86_030661 [Trapa natans]|uniref:Uncharacterized protein n=1 Tax=Trapa natans TaxID=22666 RepID=A0AAN7RDV1_TRANT|nr:hypothetical protein SAY86_030661 [Trapa natans]